ncbi:hypothetical protein TNCV_3008811 [Trichonephila clavipes]|nr:hypothetical protein TNCV_3008811 [Trichonephila clavipes]
MFSVTPLVEGLMHMRSIETQDSLDNVGQGWADFSRVRATSDFFKKWRSTQWRRYGENASHAAEIVNGVYGADTVTANYVQFWFRRFLSGIFDVKVARRRKCRKNLRNNRS